MAIRTLHRRSLAIIGVILAMVAVVALVTHRLSSSAADGPSVIVADADFLLPGDTLQDWVTYGDALAQVSVIDERRLPVSPGDKDRAYVPRGIRLHVDRVLWTRSSTVPSVPSVLRWSLDGWTTIQGNRQVLLRVDSEPLMEVGKTYLAVITHLPDRAGRAFHGWIPLNDAALVPVAGGRLDVGDSVVSRSRDPHNYRQSLAGRPVSALVSDIQGASPDPKAAPYMRLPADQRYLLTQRSR